MRNLLIALLLLCGSFVLSAQRVLSLGGMKSSPNDTIVFEVFDSADYRVFYKSSYVPDSTLVQRKIEGQALLLIGKKYQGFMDYNQRLSDSIFNVKHKAGEALEAINEALGYAKRATSEDLLIKGYPEQGSTLFQEYVSSRMRYRYTDNHGAIAWTLHKDSTEIHGYKALKATCDYRGRSYTAWYTPDIPISSGPYVFGGLPGLILQIEDSKGHYRYEISGFQRIDYYDPIYLTTRHVIQSTREKVRQIRQNIADSPSSILKTLPGKVKNISAEAQRRATQPRPYNPIELE